MGIEVSWNCKFCSFFDSLEITCHLVRSERLGARPVNAILHSMSPHHTTRDILLGTFEYNTFPLLLALNVKLTVF